MMLDDTLYNTRQVLQLLTLETLSSDRFRGQSLYMGNRSVFGGQVLGQALAAACETVADRRPHSLHSLFLLPGNTQLPIDYEVERLRDGGSFSARRVVAMQDGKRIFAMSVSFQQVEDGLSHQKTMPECRDPDTLPSSVELWCKRVTSAGRAFSPVPAEFRADGGEDIFSLSRREPVRKVWARSPVRLDDLRSTHETLFAYLSDYGLLSTSLQPHGIGMGDPRLQMASLDHTIWFHRPFRMDEWLLFSMESPSASGGRGLNLAHVFDRQGGLVATVAQEGLIRLRGTKSS
jgi:acyl-CoA thioesterase-2